MNNNLDKLITESLAIEARDAREAGALGYMARALVQATMPHKRIAGSEFSRINGSYSLSILAPVKIGLPYGVIPRLLISWVTTEAVRTKQRELVLGDSLSEFMEKLGLLPTGGKWGSITRLRNQTRKLFSSTISCSYNSDELTAEQGFRIADKHLFWWDTKQSNQRSLWESTVTLTETFFNEIRQSPVPIDMEVLKAIKRSPMAIDIYCWLTYRMSYLAKPTQIPWEVLQAQFGADYSNSRMFKWNFLKHLKTVLLFYPEAKVESLEKGLFLKPSKVHIPKLK